MSIMVKELYRALKRAGVDDASADEAASSIMGIEHLDRLALKEDVAELKVDLLKWTTGLLLAQIGLFAGIIKLMLR